MSEQSNGSKNGLGVFSYLYRTRFCISKGSIDILNLSLLFSIISVLVAPWLAVAGIIVSLVLGYRFSLRHNVEGFAKDIDDVVKDAAGNVRNAAETVKTAVNGLSGQKDEQ